MSSDETFLEAFLDSLNGLPHELRRNMELMKDLDKTCS
jgi:Inhibitor of growth proteins N-terminal histone-binding